MCSSYYSNSMLVYLGVTPEKGSFVVYLLGLELQLVVLVVALEHKFDHLSVLSKLH